MSVAIYTRQSIDKKDSISIESQIDFCKKEIINEEYKIYNDKGYSGKNIERPQFKQMLNDIKNGFISKVVVYKLDRISRNLLDFANIIEEFKKYNVNFISCNEKFDTNSPMGTAMLSIIMVFAQLERETIQKRVKDNYYARGAKGMYMGGRAPYGFKKIETKLDGKKTYTFEENPQQLPFLLKMYELYANSNMSLGRISDYLNKSKIPSAEGGLWDSGKVSRIMRSPVYVKADADIYTYYKNRGSTISNDISDFVGENGCYLYGRREANERKYTNVENHVLSIALHKGIIDSSTWLACQYKLDSNKQIKNTGQGKYSWLSGLMKCGHCGKAIKITCSKEKRYLVCSGRTNYKMCDGFKKTMYTDTVEEIIKLKIIEVGNRIENGEFHKEKMEDSNSNKLKLQIVEIDNQIENLIAQLAQGSTIVNKYLNETIEKLDIEKNEILSQINKSTIEKKRSHSKDEILENIKNWEDISIEEKKKVCAFLFEKITITEDLITGDLNDISF